MSILARLMNPLKPLPVVVSVRAPAGGMTPEAAAKENMHACDEVVAITIWKPADGQHVQQPMSFSGIHNGPLSSVEMFRCWALLAFDLMKRDDLDPELRALAAIVNSAIDGPLSGRLAQMLQLAEKERTEKNGAPTEPASE